MNIGPKIIGWGLLVGGIVLIVWTLISSYNIFTGQALAPEFFEVEKEIAVSPEKSGSQDIQAQMQEMIGEQLKGILPADSLISLLNLAVWSMLAFILIFGGTQISSLGIKLIKG